MSSPSKAPAIGHDGTMRTRAGGGGGFEVSILVQIEAIDLS